MQSLHKATVGVQSDFIPSGMTERHKCQITDKTLILLLTRFQRCATRGH